MGKTKTFITNRIKTIGEEIDKKVATLIVGGMFVLLVCLWYYFKPIVSWLGDTIETPRWFCIALGLGWVIVMVAFSVMVIAKVSREAYRRYTADWFGRMVWTWKWSKKSGPINLTPLCGTCERVLQTIDDYEKVIYKCAHCGYSVPTNQTENDVHREIITEIEYKVRTGKWKDGVPQPWQKSST